MSAQWPYIQHAIPIQIFYTYIYHVVMYIFSFTLTRPHVIILGHVNVNIKIICKVALSLGLLSSQTFIQG